MLRALPASELAEKIAHQRKGHHKHAEDGLAYDGTRLTPIEDFDFDEIDRRLGLSEPEIAPIRNWTMEKFVAATEALNEIIAYLARGNTLHSIGLRGLALSWALRPELFIAKTNADLAKRHGITRQAFGRPLLALFKLGHERFFHNRLQSTVESREMSRKLTTESHARRKEAAMKAAKKRKAAARRERKAKRG